MDNSLIKRQAAIDALGEAPEVWTESPEEFAALNQWEMDVVAIKAVPSAERPRGEWIEVGVLPEVYDIEGVKTWGSKMQCDQCGFRFTAVEGHISQYNYCPNCGADMRGGGK